MTILDSNDHETVCEPAPTLRYSSKKRSKHRREENISPQHQELIKYVQDSWLLYSTESGKPCTPSTSTASGPDNHRTWYYEDGPRPPLKGFKPFELELMWGKRLYNSLPNST